MKNFIYIVVFCFAFLQVSYSQTPDVNGILYVKKGVGGNGSSWGNALSELADALKAAKDATAGTVKQIWVAGGTYYPLYAADFASTDNRDKAFVLVKDVKLYGGFTGTETSLTNRSLSLTSNKTILSGDFGTADDYTDNAYHVLIASGDMGTAVVDGVTIMKGCTTTGSETNTLTINGNAVMRIAGGGFVFHASSPAISNVIICGNKATAGAGVYMGYSSNPSITNSIISGNTADISGTGNGGAMFAYSSSPVFTNVVLAGNNAAGWGGAFALSSATPLFYNSIIYGNGSSQPVWTISGSYTMQYSMLQGGAANATNHNMAGTNPYFVNAPSYSSAPFTNGDYSLQKYSPVIDMGSNSLYAGVSAFTTDLAGGVRVYNYASGGVIDMGAIEGRGINADGIIYVKKGATGAGDSWANAMGELGDALNDARDINAVVAGKVKQIWVAGGTYYPQYTPVTSADSRDKTFLLLQDVKIYGGFAGSETSLANRNLSLTGNKSILSGDLGTPNSNTDNVYHVVAMVSAAGSAELNGFTITEGNANRYGNLTVNGTGLLGAYGGAMQLVSTSPVLANIEFISNTATNGGALMLYLGVNSSIQDVVFKNNTANYGGAIFVHSGNNSVFDRVIFSGNRALVNGGAMYLTSSVAPVFKNVQITGNKADVNGGAAVIASNTGNTVSFLNSVISGNSSFNGVIYTQSANIAVTNSIVYGNSHGIISTGGSDPNTVVYSLVQGINADAANNIIDGATDPLFVTPAPYANAPSTAGNYALQSISPVMNKGSNALYAGVDAATIDLAGNARIYNYASGGNIDLGALEHQGLPGQYITVADTVKTYGDTAFAPVAFASSGLAVTLQSSDNSIVQPFIDAADGNKSKLTIKKAGVATITASQAGNATYAAATNATFTVTVNKAALTVTAVDTAFVYSGATFSGGNGITYNGFVNNEDATQALAGTVTYTGSAQGAKNAGTYVITPGNLTAQNYTITYQSGMLTVNKAALSITASSLVKTYDGIAFSGGNGVTYSGFVNNEDSTAALTGALIYSGTSQGAINYGPYSLTPSGLTAANYNITFYSNNLTITKAPLTVTANDFIKTYDGGAFTGGNGLAYTGFVNSEDSTQVLKGLVTYTGNSQGAINAGSYDIIPGGLSATNYAITYAKGTLTVGKAALTITAKDSTKVYDGLAFSNGNGVSYSGFVNNEDSTAALTGAITYAGTSQGSKNVNTYTIIPGGLVANNYTITFANGALSITKAPLDVTARDSVKTYNGAAFSNGNGVTYSGFVNNEDSTAALAGAVTYSGTSQGAVNSGNYTIIPAGLTAANYSITYHSGSLDINKAGLTVTAKDSTKTYDGTAFTGGNGVNYTGFATGDNASVLGGTLSYSGTSQNAVNAGKYVITPGGYTSGNYDISYVNDTLTIDEAALTITATDSAKVYDGNAFAGGNGLAYSGFVHSEDSTAALTGAVSYTGNSQGAINVNSYDIIPGGLSAVNYAITYAKGTLTVGKAALTITAKDSTKVYNGLAFSNGNGVSYSGFVNNEDSTAALTGAVTYAGTSQGATNVNTYTIIPGGLVANNYSITFANGTLAINKAVLEVTARDSVKTYDGVAFSNGNGVIYSGFVNNEDSTAALTGAVTYSGTSQGAVNSGDYTIIPAGLAAANYSITYHNGSLDINKAALTVTAKDSTKTYDGTAFAGGNGVNYAGFATGDNASVLGGTLSYSGTSQNAVNAGKYVIIPGGYTSGNYDISYVNDTLTIDKAALTITATDSAKVYDGNAFAGGNGLAYSGFVHSEDSTAALTGAVSYTGNSQGAINVNSYDIIPGGLFAANYAITYANGTLTVGKAALTITAKDSTKVYDGLAFSNGNGVSYSGFVNNEDSTAALTGAVTYTGTSQGATNVNTYTIVPDGLVADNYSITYANGTLTINKAALEVTARDTVKTYDGLAFNNGNGLIYTGFVNNEDATVLTGTVIYSGSAQGAVNSGDYTIVPSGVSADNYTISYTNGKLTVNKAALMVTANDTARCYGIANPVFRISYNGFVNNETQAVLTSEATAASAANAQSVAGGYNIAASGAAGSNYAISYSDGTLTVRALPVSTISATEGTILCGVNDTLALTASGNYTYEWYLDSEVITGQSAAQLDAAKTGAYAAKVTDAYGCVNNTNNSITLTRLLAPSPAFSFDTWCAGTPVAFTNASDVSTSGTVAYTWNSGDGQTSTAANTQFTYAAAGSFTTALTVTPTACPALVATVTKSIAVEAPVASVRLATVNTSAALPTQLAARSLTNASYTWLPGTGLSNTAIYNPVTTLNETQQYTIQMSFPSGCVTADTLLVNVFISNDVLVPNVFTPNGDGQNDLLLPNLRGNIKLRYFRVFNRWGKKVFESSDPAQGWDGRVNGELQPLATYVWTAEAVDNNGKAFHRQGSVTLLR
ncbi:gliding motility-associated C-terminal domain-containing protein [Filimonas lacunae]|uniref:Gliding motility-associated C-terminal domain-containing protein n=1 Tax=Filimonas lacunae TaxID=477680 RepID=A0A1N7R4X4_9BACT|nr:MBG domain-containing protein [Filimonas lacunae]SIT30172.1 gliding motility-associated C-terminal domain-containing protein [Filimonas lacunae]